MRTTVTLDADVFEAAKEYAESRSLSLGKALSELARRGVKGPYPTKMKNGLLVLTRRPGEPLVSNEEIRALIDEG
jgi:hypothetical protein